MDFVKMEGLGNDFVVAAGPLAPAAEQVARWCHRRRGIGADGVLVVTQLAPERVRMEYWNADGSRAEMCGNGLRCVARYAADRRWVSGEAFVVETDVGDYPVELRPGGRVRALLGVPRLPDPEIIEVAGTEVRPLSMGNPHAVLFVDESEAAPVTTLGPEIEKDHVFPNNTNVEFVEVAGRSRLRVRTWERGVGETLACGTGAGAAAAAAHRAGLVDEALTVELLGGELDLEITPDGVWMEGPADYVFEGRLPG